MRLNCYANTLDDYVRSPKEYSKMRMIVLRVGTQWQNHYAS